MKISIASAAFALAGLLIDGVQAFVPAASTSLSTYRPTALAAKYNSMEEILDLFPEDKPVLINFYDASTEGDIKDDIFRAKQLLADRATLVSIKQQD